MPTAIEFVVHSDQTTVRDVIGPQLEPTPVDVQPAVFTINTRNERTTRDSSGIWI